MKEKIKTTLVDQILSECTEEEIQNIFINELIYLYNENKP